MSDLPPQSHQEAEGSQIAQAAPGGIAIVGNENIIYSLSPAEAKELSNLKILLAKVKQFWVEGFLKNSLYNEVLLELGKETRLDAVEHPWERVVEVKDKPRQSISPDIKIIDIFDEMNRAMLILGEPGSGKTITLLELARDLIARAEEDPTYSQPVPVVFNLSSWSEKSKTFLEWLVEELSAKYHIPRKICRNWLESNRILALLDGLDEVSENHRASCVEAINDFGNNHGLSGLVVCCRSEEYSRIPVRLKFNGSIYLQPLTQEQVDEYLADAGPKLSALQTVLKTDVALQTLSQTPLMLNIMTLAYQGVSTEQVASVEADLSATREHLFDTYIQHMFTRKGISGEIFTIGQINKWLSWIAQKLIQHDQSIFLIENMQPSWLEKGWQQQGYKLLSGLLGGLFLGLFFGLPIGLISGLSNGLFFGLGVGLLIGLPYGLFFGLGIALSSPNIKPKEALKLSWKHVGVWLVYGMVTWLVISVNWGFSLPQESILMICLLGVGVVSGLSSLRTKPKNGLLWSWKDAIVGLVRGLFGLFVGGILSISLVIFPFFDSLVFGLGFGVVVGLDFGELTERTFPNQGIWQSAKNAVIIGLVIGLVIGLAVFSTFPSYDYDIFEIAIFFTFMLAPVGWLLFGGLAVIQHFSLRLLLWRIGYIPFRLVPFLNYSVDRIFLRRVGGGYIFIHRMLMEHFAEMELDIEN